MNLSIVSHYYNNAPTVLAALASFRAMSIELHGEIDFVLVDDHSHDPFPVENFEGIDNLRVFRIAEDVEWNMPGARNIGVHESLCDKIFLVDIDHTVAPGDFQIFLEDVKNLKLGQRGRFKRSRVDSRGELEEIESHINSFLIHKSDFLKVGGYDEHFSGHYGEEDKYFKFCCRHNGIQDVDLNARLLVRPGTATPALNRDRSVNKAIVDRFIEEKMTKSSKSMSFNWTPVFP